MAARLARQSLFSLDRPARFAFYLHEDALRLPVGGPAVMAEQLDHPLRMSKRSYLTLRVLVRDSKDPGGPTLAFPHPRLASLPQHRHPLTLAGLFSREKR